MAGERCVIYTRVSTRGQLEGSSPETQAELCRKAAAERGYTVLRVVLDAHTGTEIERPAIMELLTEARTGGFDILLSDVMDRFGRGGGPVATLTWLFDKEGVKLDFASQRFEDRPLGVLLQEVLASIAGFERSQILRRTQAGRRKRVERGERLPGKKPPYGYRYNDARTALVEDLAEATIVRRIFRERAAGSHTRAVARGLEADGVPGPTGGRWHHYIVGYIVGSPLYRGDDVGLRSQYVRKDGRKQQIAKPRDEWVRLADAPAIIDRATWQAAQPRAAGRPVLLRAEESTLAGRVECAHCGSRMSLTTLHSSGRRAYRCVRPQGRCAPGHSIPAATCDAVAWAAIERLVQQPDLLRLELARRRAADPLLPLRQAVKDRQAQLEQRRRNLLDALADTVVSEVRQSILVELERLATLGQELAAEAARLADADAIQAGLDARLDDLMHWCSVASERIADWPVLERPLVYEAVGLTIVAARGTPPQPVMDLAPLRDGIGLASSFPSI